MPATRSRISTEHTEVVTKKLKEHVADESVLTSKDEVSVSTEEKKGDEVPSELQKTEENDQSKVDETPYENGEISQGVKRKASEEEEEDSLDSIPEKKTKGEEKSEEVLLPPLEPTIESTV